MPSTVSVELYNTQTEQWEISDFKLSRAKFGFSLLSVKLADIISYTQCQKTWSFYFQKTLKYISTENACPLVLHNTCVGVATKSWIIQSFNLKIEYM